jgi:hypothetical protein
LLLLLLVLDEDELDDVDEEEPVQVVHGGPLDVLVVQVDDEVEEVCETVVAQGIYSTTVLVEQDGGGQVVSQSHTVTASAGVQ